MQLAVETKGNEISAAPKLLAALDLKGRVVCGDAMFCGGYLTHPSALSRVKTATVLHNCPIISYHHPF
jgi:predicted transposase YbfD/YdcC